MRKIISFLFFYLVSKIALATPVELLENFLHTNKTVQANFTQVVHNRKKDKISHGTMQIVRPNKFRWEYVEDEEVIISDGKYVYVYDKPLKQITRHLLSKSLGKTPAWLLTGGSNIKDYYQVSVAAPTTINNIKIEWVVLTPLKSNDNNGFNRVEIGFNQSTHALAMMKFTDDFGSKSEISFTDVKFNQEIAPSQFKVTPPAGVEVLDSKD